MAAQNDSVTISSIKSRRLTLEPQIAAHSRDMFVVLSDPAIYEFENEPPPSESWLRNRYERLEIRRSEDGRQLWLNWVIRHMAEGPIGFVQATVSCGQKPEALVAVVLASKFWGQGLAREALEAMSGELVLRYHVRVLYALLKRTNHRSKLLLERLGFSLLTPFPNSLFHAEPDELLMVQEISTESTSLSRGASRWKWVALGLAVTLVGLVVWDGADRRAADATEPLPQSPASSLRTSPPSSLKIASFNIHTGKGKDGVRSLSRIADLLSDVDFAGLYEVRGAAGRNEPNQAASLADLYQGGWLFAATERRWWSDHFGNGLVYRIPVRAALRVPLINTRGKAYRNAILATVELEHVDVQVLSVHIDRENDRRPQLQAMIDLFLGLQEPCLLMGDLNTTAADPLISKLIERTGVRSPLHESLADRLPSQNIDWIFTRGLNTVAVNLVENTASDHPVVTAEFSPERTSKSIDATEP